MNWCIEYLLFCILPAEQIDICSAFFYNNCLDIYLEEGIAMYPKLSADMSFAKREEKRLAIWQEQKLAEKIQALNPTGPHFTVYDGPPTANGKPHIGHILTRSIKDCIPRRKRMQGYNVAFKAGWDTHGLPVELEVEKELNLDGKSQIEAYGVADFIQKCKESVWRYKDEWQHMSERVAYSADMEHPYINYHNYYIESEWWLLQQIWQKGLLYKGHKILPYCPRCGTSLSSHEVAQGYKDVKENSVFVRFKVKGEDNTYILAWTTTPWTLPSNAALCVNPEIDYVKVQTEKEYLYLAEARLAAVLGDQQYKICQRYSGKELAGIEYEPLFDFARDFVASTGKKAWYVVLGDYVTVTDGTGIVHIAPAFGEDDAQIGRMSDLPTIQFVDLKGQLTPECGPYAGVFCKKADEMIINDLRKNGLLYQVLPFEHNYPHCWRCDTPLIYYARSGWFIAMTKVKEKLLQNNSRVNWLPENVRDGRFGNFLENVIDWALSRERYWGTPLPIWECPAHHRYCVGSIAELKKLAVSCPDDIELHKPFIDEIKLRCQECGQEMTRVKEVIDTWFDSGAMFFAQYHYPFENKEFFEEHFPADFISEAQDQTRGWFYSLLAIATLLWDQSPYKNVICLGLVLDKDGIKMSKHKGNVVAPQSILDGPGADAVRWYFYANSNPWLPSRFSLETVTELQGKFMSTLWNTVAFYALYAEIDQYNPFNVKKITDLPAIDRWAISRLNTLVKKVNKLMDEYQLTPATRLIQEYVDELSNWYVRRNRGRFWASAEDESKLAAYQTLFTVLQTLSRLLAPFTPFLADEIWHVLYAPKEEGTYPESVHLATYPEADENLIDSELEQEMQLVRQLVNLGRAARNISKVKNRQPLSSMTVVGLHDTSVSKAAIEQIEDELNIRNIVFSQDATSFIDYAFKPQLRTLGRRFGKNLNEVKQALASLNGSEAYAELQKNGKILLLVNGKEEELGKDDLLIETKQKADYATVSEGNMTVSLDLHLTPELLQAGLYREFVSKVQNLRKQRDYNVTDKIKLLYNSDNEVEAMLQAYRQQIMFEIQAAVLQQDNTSDLKEKFNLNGHLVSLDVEVMPN